MSTNEYEIAETLFLNLGVIGEITEGKKLNTKEKYLSLYDTTFLQGIYRWYYGDSRTSVADKIKTIVVSSSDIIKDAIKEKHSTEIREKYLNMTPEEFLKSIRVKLIQANKGLGHLKDTYLPDIIFTERVQIQINAINRQIKQIQSVVSFENETYFDNENESIEDSKTF